MRERSAGDSGSDRVSKRPRRTPRMDSSFSYSNNLNATVTASASPLSHSSVNAPPGGSASSSSEFLPRGSVFSSSEFLQYWLQMY